VQQGYECTRRYLEELVAARTQRLSQSSRHTWALSAARSPSTSRTTQTRSVVSLATGVRSTMAVVANEQMLREIASNVTGLLPNG